MSDCFVCGEGWPPGEHSDYLDRRWVAYRRMIDEGHALKAAADVLLAGMEPVAEGYVVPIAACEALATASAAIEASDAGS